MRNGHHAWWGIPFGHSSIRTAGAEMGSDGRWAPLGFPSPWSSPRADPRAILLLLAPWLAPSWAVVAAGHAMAPSRRCFLTFRFSVCVRVCVCPGLPSTYSISFGNDTRYFACTCSEWSLPLLSLSPLPRSFAFRSSSPSPLLSSSLMSSLGSSLFSSALCLKSDPLL